MPPDGCYGHIVGLPGVTRLGYERAIFESVKGQPVGHRSGLVAAGAYLAGGVALILIALAASRTPAPAEVVATDTPPAAIAARDRDGNADAEQAGAAASSTTAPPPSTTTTTRPPTTTTTEPPAGPVTIAFGGDVHFEGLLAEALAQQPLTMLEPVAEMMADADLAIINLETAVTERGSPSAKQFNFRTTPAAFDALRSAGIDVVSMANNHGLDFGPEGLEDSLAYAEQADFPVVGIGRNAAEAYAPWSTTINGQRIAVIGATQVLDSSLISSWTATDDQPGLASAKEVETLSAAVSAARQEHDTVIVFLHWGVEGETCPVPRQVELSDTLIAAGADLVVGGHAHRVQGGGIKDGAFVHYGLGNFVFYTAGGPGTTSGVLRVTVEGRSIEDYEWIPARLQAGVATRLDDDELDAGRASWEALRACTDLDP